MSRLRFATTRFGLRAAAETVVVAVEVVSRVEVLGVFLLALEASFVLMGSVIDISRVGLGLISLRVPKSSTPPRSSCALSSVGTAGGDADFAAASARALAASCLFVSEIIRVFPHANLKLGDWPKS